MIQYIGLDVGGTSIRAGGMDETGQVRFETKVPTCQGVATGADLIAKLEALIRAVPGWAEARAVGIGVPGAVDRRTNTVTVADNLTLLNGLPLAQTLSPALGKPVLLENDARAAALAEAVSGAGAGKETVCYMTISTGLGGAMVKNGQIYHGSTNMGSYLCRMILDGGQNCEALLSGTSLRRRLAAELGRPVDDAGEVFALAASGDPAATALVEGFRAHLAVLFLNLAVTSSGTRPSPGSGPWPIPSSETPPSPGPPTGSRGSWGPACWQGRGRTDAPFPVDSFRPSRTIAVCGDACKTGPDNTAPDPRRTLRGRRGSSRSCGFMTNSVGAQTAAVVKNVEVFPGKPPRMGGQTSIIVVQ